MRLSERSDILRFLDPTNKQSEYQQFIQSGGTYSPVFSYSDRHIAHIEPVINRIKSIRNQVDTLRDQGNLTQFMRDKCTELVQKFELVLAYYRQDTDNIQDLNIKLFGNFQDSINQTLLPKQGDMLEKQLHVDYHDLLTPLGLEHNEFLDRKQVYQLIEYHLKHIWLSTYRIVFGLYGSTNMQVSIWPKPVVYINKQSSRSSQSLCVSIMHEIYGHLQRYQHGKTSWTHLLQWWMSYYLTTEEGIAMIQSARIEWFEHTYNRLRQSYILLKQASWVSRWEGVKLYQKAWFTNLWFIFRNLLRIKRGVIHTSISWSWCGFLKDKVYFDGFCLVCNYLCSIGVNTYPIDYDKPIDQELMRGRVSLPII